MVFVLIEQILPPLDIRAKATAKSAANGADLSPLGIVCVERGGFSHCRGEPGQVEILIFPLQGTERKPCKPSSGTSHR